MALPFEMESTQMSAKRTASSFKFDDKTTEVLENLRIHYGASSKAEVLRKAIALLDIAAAAEDDKKILVVESTDGKIKRQITVR